MSSLTKKDRVSLCSFTFSDGRRCRTPRIRNHPHFCFYHAQKEARARTAEKLGKDLAYFFSGEYLSACDLSTSLGRLIPAVVRGDVKPRTARTIAYLAQTLLQSIHLAQHEYINAFSTEGWREVIRNSVNDNHDYGRPPKPAPAPEQPQSSQPTTTGANSPASLQPTQTPKPAGAVAQAFRPAESTSSLDSSLATRHSSLPQPLPRTSAEFVDQVVARLPQSLRSDLTGQTGSLPATPPSPPPQPAVIPPAGNPVASLANGGEGPASSPTPAPTPAAPVSPGCHPERSEGPQPIPATQPTPTQASAQAPSLTPAPAPQAPMNCHSQRSAHSASRMVLREEESASSASPTPAAQPPSQEAPEQPRPVAAAPSASRQEPRPAAATLTGPSGLPLLAQLPPPKPKTPLGSSSQ
jgi:hypothetical protein